jgi:hypothetical protein
VGRSVFALGLNGLATMLPWLLGHLPTLLRLLSSAMPLFGIFMGRLLLLTSTLLLLWRHTGPLLVFCGSTLALADRSWVGSLPVAHAKVARLLRLFFGFLFFFKLFTRFFKAAQAYLSHYIYKFGLYLSRFAAYYLHCLQFIGLLAQAVHFFYFEHPADG